MKVLIVEPMKPCYVREVSGLKDMQEVVGGDIEATYPFEDLVGLGLPFNRPLMDKSGLPYDIVCGTFFLAGLGAEDFVSLTEEQIRRYKKLYDNVMVITAVKEPLQGTKTEQKKKRGNAHER